MSKSLKAHINCYLLIQYEDKKLSPLIDALNDAIKEIGGKLSYNKKKTFVGQTILDEITKADIIIADISVGDNYTYYGLGLAKALGKLILSIFPDNKLPDFSTDFSSGLYLGYDLSKKGIEKLKNNLKSFLNDLIKNPLHYAPINPLTKKIERPAYIIDLEKLEPREFDNLCFELISQMGFKRVNWGKEFKEIDVVATLPKKDPDGFDYQELWMIVTGNQMPAERLLETVLFEPEFLFHKLQRNLEFADHRSQSKIDGPITVLFILREGEKQREYFEKEINRIESRLRLRKNAFNLRVRIWDSNYLIDLIQKYPQIAYKYFSEETKFKSKYRKTPEELYKENVKLSDEILEKKLELEKEKKKRFIAEREMAWKDVAFKAAHKLGNPVDATDTFLQRLKTRIEERDWKNAKDIAEHMDLTIEEAKSVIGQFKSLTKLEEIKQAPCDITKIIRHSLKSAEEKGVKVKFQFEDKLPLVSIDPDKITECFNELVANSMHWLKNEKKEITVTVEKCTKKNIPQSLDAKQNYLRVIFQDSGAGVEIASKEKIFAPFFTTYEHGSGIGLSIVKKIIDLHTGYIIENGKHGEGVRFEIYLPIAKNIIKTKENG